MSVSASAECDSAIRALAAERHLPESHLARWLAFDTASRAALLDVARRLRMRTGQLVASIDLLDEIAARDKLTVAAILSENQIRRVLMRGGSTPDRSRALVEELRARRFPTLRAATARLNAEIATLDLPRSVTMLLPRNLASDVLTIQIRTAGIEDFERAMRALAGKRDAIARIIALLGGDDCTSGGNDEF